MRNGRWMVMLACALVLAAQQAAQAQAVAPPPNIAASRALTQEMIGLYETVCLAATLRGEAVPDLVARVLGTAAAALPADQLRGNQAVRETAGWLVTGLHGRYRLNTIEPAAQCGLVGEGVDHDAFLAGATGIMDRAATLMPGWLPRGAPERTSGPRPFGTLSYLGATFARRDGPPPAPQRVLSIVASVAQRTDGRPDTGVLSVSVREEAAR